MLQTLKKFGLRATPQRMAIMKLLEGNTNHPSVEEIHHELKPAYPSLSTATVYNTLEALTKVGEIQEISIDPQRRRFDPVAEPHGHFLCEKCQKVYDIDIHMETLAIPKLVNGFSIRSSSLYLYGICANCNSDYKDKSSK